MCGAGGGSPKKAALGRLFENWRPREVEAARLLIRQVGKGKKSVGVSSARGG